VHVKARWLHTSAVFGANKADSDMASLTVDVGHEKMPAVLLAQLPQGLAWAESK
jgi:hypothetical protein